MGRPSDILIADDEEHIPELLAEVLTDAGYRGRTVYDGGSALAVVQEHTPALMLLDTMISVKSGLEVVRVLRAQGYDRLPIILMSTSTPAESLLPAGASDFLPKPFFLDDVLDCIRGYIDDAPPPTVRRHTKDTEQHESPKELPRRAVRS
jgi:DNA-binding response OmpR family regulator